MSSKEIWEQQQDLNMNFVELHKNCNTMHRQAADSRADAWRQIEELNNRITRLEQAVKALIKEATKDIN